MSDKQIQLPETEEGWRERLAPEQYHILREQGTERPFSGELLTVDDDGTFRCAGCDAAVFSSETKFSSKTGWPSFHDALEGAVELRGDDSHGMQRTDEALGVGIRGDPAGFLGAGGVTAGVPQQER
ncbi:MAG: peptide-methionine (R)-S-oxide reductase [Haloquadratum sp.]|nr:peptide-methionine (R)-S-oxide reductase [Haloquadratum sp.]